MSETVPGHADLVERITEYLSLGGLWNPELMDHEKVRELLIDCRAALRPEEAAGQGETFPQPSRKDGGEPCGECHLQPGETCDICGAVATPRPEADAPDIVPVAFVAEMRRRVRNIWGAISSDQVEDKDVLGQAKRLLEYIDVNAPALAALASEQVARLKDENKALVAVPSEPYDHWSADQLGEEVRRLKGLRHIINDLIAGMIDKRVEKIANPTNPLLAEMAKHIGWELDWGEKDPDWEGSECGWRVHERSGNRNDREWKMLGFGATPEEALRRSLTAAKGG